MQVSEQEKAGAQATKVALITTGGHASKLSSHALEDGLLFALQFRSRTGIAARRYRRVQFCLESAVVETVPSLKNPLSM
ncbi:MAG: hypothetical protein ACJ746_26465 [Bryobacteraceae bacterium]